MEVVLLKCVVVGLFGLTMGTLLDKYKEAEHLLESRRMSWTQFQNLKNAIIGAGGIMFVFTMFLFAL